MLVTVYDILTFVITFSTLLGYLNHRFFRVPMTIAIMSGALLFSLTFIVLGQIGHPYWRNQAVALLSDIDFKSVLLDGMLSFLLFAGALNVDLSDLKRCQWEVAVLATFSTVFSMLCVGGGMYYLLPYAGVRLPVFFCLLFGALISPTDPIAVLSIFKEMRAPRLLQTIVESESLFNDGVGVVVFLTLSASAFSYHAPSISDVFWLFLQQAVGGMVFGLVLGGGTTGLLAGVKDHELAILLTVSSVSGGYWLAQHMGVSGPLAMVVSGIMVGHVARHRLLSARMRASLDTFWALIDELLNMALFCLMGLELLVIPMGGKECVAMLCAVPVVLLARFMSVGLPFHLFKKNEKRRAYYVPYMVTLLTWGGLRGGLAMALALSLPVGPHRHVVLAITYGVVLFSVLVQGLSMRRMLSLAQN